MKDGENWARWWKSGEWQAKKLGQGGYLSSIKPSRSTLHLSPPGSFLETYLCGLRPQAIVPSSLQLGLGNREP